MPLNFDAHRYCETLSRSTVLSDQVIGWTGRWSMLGSFVVCSQCLAMQQVKDATERFLHLPGCKAIRSDQHPWHELANLLTHIPPLSTSKSFKL